MAKHIIMAGKLTLASIRAQRRLKRTIRASQQRLSQLAVDAVAANWPEDMLVQKDDIVDNLVERMMKALHEELIWWGENVEASLIIAAEQGVKQSAIEFTTTEEMMGKTNQAAKVWAEDRAAEMVGMKKVNGQLIENPNAKLAVSDTIRSEIKAVVVDAFSKEKAPMAEIQKDIQNVGSFSEYRAELIARTEISRAQVQGNMTVWKFTGMIGTYDWLVSADENRCLQCVGIAEGTSVWGEGPFVFGEGPVPIDDTHPQCQCGMVADEIIEQGDSAQSISEEKMKETGTQIRNGGTTLALPITKIDEEKRMVYVTATSEALDSVRDVTDYDSISKAFDKWPGNIREMHQPIAAGSAIEIIKNDEKKTVDLGIYISKGAESTWEKVLDKTLKGASIGVPAGHYRREPINVKVEKADGTSETVRGNRLFVEKLSEISLVDNPANADCNIWLVKSIDGELVATENVDEGLMKEAAVEDKPKATEEDAIEVTDKKKNKKKVPLKTEEEVKSAIAYFTRPKNRRAYDADVITKIDADIEAAKKGFSIGEYAEKSDGTLELCKCSSDNVFTPINWVSMNAYTNNPGQTDIYLPRTFGAIWEESEDVAIFPAMGMQLGKTIANILTCHKLTGAQQQELIQTSFNEFMEEISDELMEADETAAKLSAVKFETPDLQKAGARNNKADVSKLQAAHDTLVDLGAVCKATEVKMDPTELSNLVDGLTKALLPLAGTKIVMLTEDQVQKMAPGISLEQVGLVKTQITELGTVVAEQVVKLTEVSEIASKHEGELALKASAAVVEDAVKRLAVVENQPATSLPVARPALAGITASNGTVKAESLDEVAVLKRLQADTPDALTKQAIGNRIFILETKRQ